MKVFVLCCVFALTAALEPVKSADSAETAPAVLAPSSPTESNSNDPSISNVGGRPGGGASDIRLKKDIELLGEVDGLKWYRFKYTEQAAQLNPKINPNQEQRGVMAQDLLESPFSHAVSKAADGFYVVDYSVLPACPYQ
eukprot:c5750_g1_i1.p1 GENE.c5750_g1_i1~~c5750_g1_i1.p1  ORF type:complete len:139 (-),score=34.67 c5750_g1_i1:250-666(-)